LARQLQAEEHEHARRYYEEQQRRAEEGSRLREQAQNTESQSLPPSQLYVADKGSAGVKKGKKKSDCIAM
jgi:hypothetical protein